VSEVATLERPAKVEEARKPPQKVVLLGPQSLRVTVGEVIESLKLPKGPIVTITAGWQEREAEDAELDYYLNGQSANLRLYRRLEGAFATDVDLAEAHRKKQRTLGELRRLYNIRLSAAMDAMLTLLREEGDPKLIEPEQQAALETLRTIDSWHLSRITELWSEFDERFRPSQRDAIVRQRADIASVLKNAAPPQPPSPFPYGVSPQMKHSRGMVGGRHGSHPRSGSFP
jgi:hypothetical protein